jgi:BatD DUF11 like domain
MKKNLNHRGHRRHREELLTFLLCVLCVLCGENCLAGEPPIVGRPAEFSGAIGGPFVLTLTVEPNTVAVEEPFTLTLRIVGPGNLKEIRRPPLGKLDAFKLFAVDDLDDDFAHGTPPSRTFRYRLRARSADVKQIPPFKFVYFNSAIVPASRGYQTTYAEGATIAIKPPISAAESALPQTIARLRGNLELDPADVQLHTALRDAREQVPYASADLRPSDSAWPYWLSLRRFAWAALLACIGGSLAFIRWLMIRRRGWFVALLIGFTIAATPAIGTLLEWRERARNEETPVVVVARETVLRRGNGDEYPARVDAGLPPGAEVRRLFERHRWLQVELANGVVGWVPRYAVVD